MISIITVGVAWSISVGIKHRRRPALERRRRALAEGTRYTGKIVYAGVKMESEKISSDCVSAEDEKYKNMYRRVPNYWVEVEYSDPQSGQTKQGVRITYGEKHGAPDRPGCGCVCEAGMGGLLRQVPGGPVY